MWCSITGDISTTLPSSVMTMVQCELFCNSWINFENLSGKSFVDNVSTTVTVQTEDADGTTNQISGPSTNGRD